MEKVTVYSSDTCPYCVLAKNYLNENNIEFEEKNVGTDPVAKQELQERGYRNIPLIVIGDEEVLGFDQERIAGLLDLQ